MHVSRTWTTTQQEDYGVATITRIDRGSEQELLARLDQLSDDEVASLLSEMLDREAVTEAVARSQEGEAEDHAAINRIGRIDRGIEQELLAELDQLSDDEVDALLSEMLAQEDVTK